MESMTTAPTAVPEWMVTAMREIKFRGKRKDNGNWIYGTVVYPRTIKNEIYVAIVPIIDGESVYSMIREVTPETVGQFTGLYDKNEQEIFEGDILQYFDDEIQLVEWSDEWVRTMLHTYGEYERKKGRKTIVTKHEGWNDLDDYPLEEMPILGNIHDNPELLGGEGDA